MILDVNRNFIGNFAPEFPDGLFLFVNRIGVV